MGSFHDDKDTEKSIRRYLPVFYLLVFGVIVSFVLFRVVLNWEITNQRYEFDSWAKAYTNAVERTLSEYVGALQFVGDFFDNSDMVTRKEFNSLVGSLLQRYPGIQAIGWDPLIKHGERAKYEKKAQKAGFDEFQFTERNKDNQLVTAAAREEYVVVYYIHPLENNKPALGYDIASNPTRLKAINNSFETGTLVATGRIKLVQETDDQYGVLLLLPVYQAPLPVSSVEERLIARRGFVVEVLRIGQAIETALKGFSDTGLTLSLYDISANNENQFLYHRDSETKGSSIEPIMDADSKNELYSTSIIEFAARKWKIVLSPAESYLQSRNPWQSKAVFIGSLLITLTLAFYTQRKIKHTIEIEKRIKKQIQTNEELANEVRERTAAEAELDKTILNLQNSLDEIKALRGILPICSFCKKVRDDKGYWEQVDVYIHKYLQADISHSICPECMKNNYPEIYDLNNPDTD